MWSVGIFHSYAYDIHRKTRESVDVLKGGDVSTDMLSSVLPYVLWLQSSCCVDFALEMDSLQTSTIDFGVPRVYRYGFLWVADDDCYLF